MASSRILDSVKDQDELIDYLIKCKTIPEAKIRALCNKAKEVLVKESNVQPVKAPVTVCGDIHG